MKPELRGRPRLYSQGKIAVSTSLQPDVVHKLRKDAAALGVPVAVHLENLIRAYNAAPRRKFTLEEMIAMESGEAPPEQAPAPVPERETESTQGEEEPALTVTPGGC